jgi:hypothetical protein
VDGVVKKDIATPNKQIKSSKRKIVNMHKKGRQFGALFYALISN